MGSLRRHEGYVLIDHQYSPGVAQSDVAGRPGLTPVVGAGVRYESATVTCSHCQQVLILNPQRSRERGYCRKCDHYICDQCTTVMAHTLECLPFAKILDQAQEQAFLAEQRGSLIIP